MCYGYGVNREVLFLFDASESMGVLYYATIPFVYDALRLNGCVCPPFGVAFHRLDHLGRPRLGIGVTPLGAIGSSDVTPLPIIGGNHSWYQNGEDPLWALKACAEAWNYRPNAAVGGEFSSIDAVWVERNGVAYPVSGLGGRPKLAPPRRIIVWLGDEPSYPPASVTTAEAIAALQAAEITVLAVNIGFSTDNGINFEGQAAEICEATGGEIISDDFWVEFLGVAFADGTPHDWTAYIDLQKRIANSVIAHRWRQAV